MKKSTKKRIAGVAAFAMAMVLMVAFCGCGDDAQKEQQTGGEGTENPIHEVASADELCQNTNIEIDAPEGAENVKYSYIEASDEDSDPTGQVEFTKDGVEYTYRAASTGMTDLNEYIKDTEYSDQDLAGAMMEGAEVGTDISGMYGPWDAAALVTVGNRDGVCAINDGESAVVIWLDVVPGIIYSLSAGEGVDQTALMDTAEAIFVPVQGEVDGDE